MTLAEVNSRFVYKTDTNQYGRVEHWATLSEVGDKLVGDCESYALHLKKYVPEFKDYDLYHCKLGGEGHCILSNGFIMIDNNTQRRLALYKYMEDYKVTDLRKYWKIEVLWKVWTTKLLGFVPFIRS